MHLVCLDLEGVLVPEIWINVALATGIEELKLTTRDISDYDVLMNKRIGILHQHNLKLKDIQKVIGSMDPLEGAGDFLAELKSLTQVVILSDTFDQFARPLMEKLHWPTLFCNTLVIDESGAIAGYRLRQKDGKRKAVEAFKTIGLAVIASGDSYNDITMLKTANAGVLFRPPENVKAEFPELPAVDTYTDLLAEIKKHL